MSKKKSKPVDEFKAEVDARKQHEVDTAMADLRRDRDRAVRRYDNLLADFNGFKTDCAWLDLLDGAFSKPPKIEHEGKTGTGQAVAVAVGCDWHAFEAVKPANVNGLNEYTPEICQASVEEFFRAIVAWTEIHRAGIKIDTLVLALLGDLMTNMLHDDQKEDNAGTPQEEILFVLDLITSGLDYLLEHGGYKKIVCVCCDGNHGRDTERIRYAGRSRHSHEWLLYQFLARTYAGKVEFVIADAYHVYQPVLGYTLRFHHGDGIRYMGGIGGLTIPMNKAISAWNKARHADYDVFGHWHQMINPARFLSVGSVIGYNAYAVGIKADFEPPQQALFLVDSRRFVTSVNRIYVR